MLKISERSLDSLVVLINGVGPKGESPAEMIEERFYEIAEAEEEVVCSR